MSSKSSEAQDDQIPSYEESIASSSPRQSQPTGFSQKTPTTFQQRIKEQRQRRIATILLDHVEPAIAVHLENGTNEMTLILLGADALDGTVRLSVSNITSPSLAKPTTLIRLNGNDFNAQFLTTWSLIQELSDTLVRSMVDPATFPQLQAQLPQISSVQAPELPERPAPKSWLKRTFGLPPADQDPTGQTGSWKLGWRSEENPALTSRTVATNDLTLTANLTSVTFRTESALGLLESSTVKCLWMDVFFRA
ncbi:uncharacterized protein AB675_2460 [Cyphellophora attinorum]|uniref:Uncharacterized protein n=1 Tax=Cyphellophora attinorum TaxID=1664694 RepID=A0A0N0NRK1_9EURO|nr:uncharacterized protein AB675_2460 [Phialophora attinorum]KPI45181.1 hypothetical protein AB675_2460 [Phialophora attinorum]